MKDNGVMLSRRALLQVLQAASAAVAVRSTLPVLNDVLIEALKEEQVLRISGTNLEMALQMDARAAVGRAWRAAVPAREFLSWVKALPEGVVTMSLDEERKRLICHSGSSGGVFAVVDADEFPPIDWVIPERRLMMPQKVFQRIARDVAVAAARDDSRPTLAGVAFAPRAGSLEVAATDGYRLAVLRIGGDAIAGHSIIVPAEALRKVAPFIGGDDVVVGWGERQAVFALNRQTRMMTLLVSGQYPPYHQIEPESFRTTARVQKSLLQAAIRQTAIFAKETKLVRLDIAPEGVRASAKSVELGAGEVVVPIEFSGEPLTIGFNIDYLYDAVGGVDAEVVLLLGNAPERPLVVTGVDDGQYRHIVMPMHLR